MTTNKKLKSGSQLERVLASGQFALTGELGPPKGADRESAKKKAQYLKGVVDAVNITDNQTAIVRMSSLAAGIIAQEEGVEAVMQITARDRNRLAIQSDVLGAYAMGLRNILCISGDHQAFGNHKTAKNVFDVDSLQMIRMLKEMRDEKVFACGEEIRNTRKGPYKEPRIFIGAAANPFGDPMEFRLARLAKKVKAGADFIQTQSIYDLPRFRQWMSEVCQRGLHQKVYILAGVTPLKSVKMAEVMRDSVPGMKVPEEVIQRLRDAEDEKEEGSKIAIETMEELKELPGLSGIHLMVIGGEKMARGLAEKAGLLPRPEVAL